MKLLEKITYKLGNFLPSYSQCGEDRIMSHLLINILKRENITYLDIGTNHPKKANNTYLFYQRGNKGVCVEPNPIICKKIRSVRPNDVCLNVGVALVTSDKLNFYVMDTDTLSTFSKEGAEELQRSGKYKITETLEIPVFNFNELIEKNFNTPPDIVSIDVEDLNEDIVQTIDFKIRPAIFCVETLLFGNELSYKKIASIKEHFLANNYSIYSDTFINTIFVDNLIFDISWV